MVPFFALCRRANLLCLRTDSCPNSRMLSPLHGDVFFSSILLLQLRLELIKLARSLSTFLFFLFLLPGMAGGGMLTLLLFGFGRLFLRLFLFDFLQLFFHRGFLF